MSRLPVTLLALLTPSMAWADPIHVAALSPTARLWLQTIIPLAAITLVVLIVMLIYVWRRQQRRRAQAQAREAFHQLATQPPRPLFSSRPAMLTPTRAGVSTAGAALETAEDSELFFVPSAVPSRRKRDLTPSPNDDFDRALVFMSCPSCSRTFEVGVSFCPYDGHSCTREYRPLQDHSPSEILAEELTPVGVCHDCHHETAWGVTHTCPRTQATCDSELVLGRFTTGEALQPDEPMTKICPECHRRHPHEHSYCVFDGAKLMSLD